MIQPRLRSPRGFSLIELLIIVAILAVLVLLVGPAVQRYLLRSKMRASAENLSRHLQRARLYAISNNVNVLAEVSDAGRSLLIWADVNGPIDGDPPDGVYNPLNDKPRLGTDHVVNRLFLESNVFFGSPNDQATTGLTTIGTRSALMLFPSGSAGATGSFNLGFRINDGDPSGNYLQIFVNPAATAKVALRKWDRTDSAWRAHREGGRPWEWYTP